MLPGADDGLVSVESTKLDGMRDFIVVESGHSVMRYNLDVARYVISFLGTGHFKADLLYSAIHAVDINLCDRHHPKCLFSLK